MTNISKNSRHDADADANANADADITSYNNVTPPDQPVVPTADRQRYHKNE